MHSASSVFGDAQPVARDLGLRTRDIREHLFHFLLTSTALYGLYVFLRRGQSANVGN
jgi:hypothetical protein